MKKWVPQEGLKLLACITMLIDHVGAVVFPYTMWLRMVGRMAFPIYCFLLAQGHRHTRSPGRYALRLAVGAVFAEIPFDLLFFGRLTLDHQSVMLTLLIGFAVLQWMRRLPKFAAVLPLVVGLLAAELCRTDYGGWGVAVIWLFGITGEGWLGGLLRTAGMTAIFWLMGSANVRLGPVILPIQLLAVLAMVPIAFYSGRKLSRSRAVQLCFYLFYPAHLAVLLVIQIWMLH